MFHDYKFHIWIAYVLIWFGLEVANFDAWYSTYASFIKINVMD